MFKDFIRSTDLQGDPKVTGQCILQSQKASSQIPLWLKTVFSHRVGGWRRKWTLRVTLTLLTEVQFWVVVMRSGMFTPPTSPTPSRAHESTSSCRLHDWIHNSRSGGPECKNPKSPSSFTNKLNILRKSSRFNSSWPKDVFGPEDTC